MVRQGGGKRRAGGAIQYALMQADGKPSRRTAPAR
jgi:hypothetical protein